MKFQCARRTNDFGIDADAAALGEFDRVVEQVDEHALQPHPVGVELHAR